VRGTPRAMAHSDEAIGITNGWPDREAMSRVDGRLVTMPPSGSTAGPSPSATRLATLRDGSAIPICARRCSRAGI